MLFVVLFEIHLFNHLNYLLVSNVVFEEFFPCIFDGKELAEEALSAELTWEYAGSALSHFSEAAG